VIDQLSSSTSLIKGGKLKALAVMTGQRVPALKDAPTLEESGIKGLDESTRTGILVPKGVPVDVVKRLNDAVVQVSKDSKVMTAMDNIGSMAESSTPAAFTDLISSE